MRNRFEQAGLRTPALDARVLTAFALGLDEVSLVTQATRPVSGHEHLSLENAAQSRLAGKPVSRIVGMREFYSLKFRLSPATLDPRPDSEGLVDCAVNFLLERSGQIPAPAKVLDLGTGTGCLLIALVHACREKERRVQGLGVDISAAALRQARINAALNNVDRSVGFRKSNWLSNVREAFDVIMSNPPYVASADINGLARDVRLHDPRVALDGGGDGLTAYRRIIPGLTKNLKPGGCAVFEIGFDQADAVEEILKTAGAGKVIRRPDLAGHPRVLQAEFA